MTVADVYLLAGPTVKKLLTVKRFFQVLPDFLSRLKAASSRALVRVWPCVALVSRLTQVGQKRAGNSHEAGPGRTTLPGFPQAPPATQEHSAPFFQTTQDYSSFWREIW